MAIINYSDQMKFTGKGYLDAKMMPVNSISDLKNIPLGQRFEGLTVTVLNDGNPEDYWLVGGITNGYWIKKKCFDDLRLSLEEGLLKLKNGNTQLGDVVDFNDFFAANDNDVYIEAVDYTKSDGDGNTGIFMRFTYNDGARKYLDMSQFLSVTYKQGSGIVIDGDVISIDDAILGRITLLETRIDEHTTAIEGINARLTALGASIDTNITSIEDLKERIDALASTTVEVKVDNITIGEEDGLHVKVLEKDGNLLKIDTNNAGESGLYASIPVFCEDAELL